MVIANDAATLPASLFGQHGRSGRRIEVRLAGRASLDEVRQYSAVVFGEGDFRTRTESRAKPPALNPGDRLELGRLRATVVRLLNHPRFILMQFEGSPREIWEGLARHGRPIQYSHVPTPLAVWDTWTPIAGPPVAFERIAGAARLATVLSVVLAGYVLGLVSATTVPTVPAYDARLTSWLAAHHLSYGVGSYWNANIVTLTSGQRIHVVSWKDKGGALRVHRWEAERSWYSPQRHDANFAVFRARQRGLRHFAVAFFGRPGSTGSAGPTSCWSGTRTCYRNSAEELVSLLPAVLAGRARPVPARYGRFHFWLALPVQSQICSCARRCVDQSVSSRHLPDCGLYSDPLDCGTKTCAPVPLQS